METTSAVMSITDEQIAEIERMNVELNELKCVVRYMRVDEVEAIISSLRAAERDAARYRWLRDSGNFSPSAFGQGWSLNCGYTRTQPSLLDAAVDTAMKGEHP